MSITKRLHSVLRVFETKILFERSLKHVHPLDLKLQNRYLIAIYQERIALLIACFQRL